MSEEFSSLPRNVSISSKLSWFAYVRRIIGFFIVLVIAGILAAIFSASSPIIANIFIYTACIIYWLLAILSIRAIKVYYDESGIWVYSGIFPWTKGVSGIKWRDLDEAVYFTGFFSWLFRSYTIRLTHRYTKSSEIIIRDVLYGNNLVQEINEYHVEMIRKIDSHEKR